jgi:8-oxo-dGTP pyrophosphatase MutT (NUDIX family)
VKRWNENRQISKTEKKAGYTMVEYNDVYNVRGQKTGKIHRRGSLWRPGEFGLVVCVWVYDGQGRLLLTRRAPGKSFAGTWENSGGAAKMGETSRQAIARELFEETGIRTEPHEFELLGSDRDRHTHYDFYCLRRTVALKDIVLLPGETDDVMWATFAKVHEMIRDRRISRVIANQFLRQEPALLARQTAQDCT